MVEMHGDWAEDFGLLLTYIYNPALLGPRKFDFHCLVALLTAGSKRALKRTVKCFTCVCDRPWYLQWVFSQQN
ncbi:hypothetical protein K466DRAFT_28644 [Polyporus arcularius HHB13444]|uniref:Uncharacterized protein n=1 Tax=Polyporus arcularius HHB13444 TaxID=1314778 RepID=A0A5C3PM54_9APHY|nr:hypothetical protein K466DRAFT_28644 [Polyporus arcularius HHB13444]